MGKHGLHTRPRAQVWLLARAEAWIADERAVDPDALVRLRRDPGLGRRLAEAARARVARQLSPQAWFTTLPDQVKSAAMATLRR